SAASRSTILHMEWHDTASFHHLEEHNAAGIHCVEPCDALDDWNISIPTDYEDYSPKENGKTGLTRIIYRSWQRTTIAVLWPALHTSISVQPEACRTDSSVQPEACRIGILVLWAAQGTCKLGPSEKSNPNSTRNKRCKT
ncbi:hypothetical protein HAX54_022835, partial [Datura stramonium]|nr:hypothetical protein [Datura stramonium]